MSSPLWVFAALFSVASWCACMVYMYTYWKSKCKLPTFVYNANSNITAEAVAHLPILKDPYVPPFWLAWGHAQTILSAFFRPIQGYAPWKRQIITVKASKYIDVDGPIALDWITPPGSTPLSDDSPILLLVPGLSGDTWSQYIHVFGWKSFKKYRIVCINFRGGAGVPTTSCQLFGACHTDDLRQSILHIADEYPKANLFVVGFSLGAVLLLKYAAEEGENHVPQLKGLCSLSSSYDPKISSDAMHSTFMGKYVYSIPMTKFFKTFISKHEKVMREHGKKHGFDYDELMQKAVYLTDLDGLYAEKVWKNERGIEELYELIHVNSFLDQIKIPTLCISTLDDPICPPVAIPMETFKNSSHCILVATAAGGHGLNLYEGWHLQGSWSYRLCRQFCDHLNAVNQT